MLATNRRTSRRAARPDAVCCAGYSGLALRLRQTAQAPRRSLTGGEAHQRHLRVQALLWSDGVGQWTHDAAIADCPFLGQPKNSWCLGRTVRRCSRGVPQTFRTLRHSSGGRDLFARSIALAAGEHPAFTDAPECQAGSQAHHRALQTPFARNEHHHFLPATGGGALAVRRQTSDGAPLPSPGGLLPIVVRVFVLLPFIGFPCPQARGFSYLARLFHLP